MQTPEYWDEKHLMCFLYLSVALSDQVITPEEKTVIDLKLKNLLNERYKLSDSEQRSIINEVHRFSSENKDAHMSTINTLSQKITLAPDTYCFLLNELEEIARANTFVPIEAHSFMFYIRLKFKKDYPSRQTSQFLA